MALNSPTFLFLFLPVFLVFYSLPAMRFRNIFLLIFSLFFYLWSDPLYSPFVFGLVLVNYLLMKGIQKSSGESRKQSRLLAIGVAVNMVSLMAFKILVTYWQPMLDLAERTGLKVPNQIISVLPHAAHLPLGLSFLTFQAISMLVDVSRQEKPPDSDLHPVFTYLIMFPKAIAGPIEQFRGIARQIRERQISIPKAASGLRRFMLGFAKKTLIADQLALITDAGIFDLPPLHIPTDIAWLAVISFTVQIYFDFSAYSDMAIGIGRMLGFDFSENFNFPYFSSSITEFWRRWHISLSNWFRDYVFYPLERKQRSAIWLSQPLNIIIVFLLTGLWHGITLSFIAWGLLHGIALALERGRFGGWLKNLWTPFQHLYALSVIMIGWVLFRSPSLFFAWNLLKTMAGISASSPRLSFSVFQPVSTLTWCALAAGILFSSPLLPAVRKRLVNKASPNQKVIMAWVQNTVVLAFFVAGIIVQAGTSFIPFIYGEF